MGTQPHPEPAARTEERRRGPSTLAVSLFMIAALLASSVASDPTTVLPRDTTILVERHPDRAAGIEIPMPVGWQSTGTPAFGSTELEPTPGESAYRATILAGRLGPDVPASAITDDRGAATALAETIEEYVLHISGTRDEQRDVEVHNGVGAGHATSFVVSPNGGDTGGGLVYVAVFGDGADRAWLAYITETPSDAPEPRWMDRVVHDVVPYEG